MALSSPQDVHYLALEGGGGKGVTYLGAVRALEDLGVLPIDLQQRGNNQIRGISGASAGAITAMLLAMGLDSNELERILSQPSTFTAFFDGPDPGFYRVVTDRNRPDIGHDGPPNQPLAGFIRQRAAQISGWTTLVSMFATLARSGAFGNVNDPMIRPLINSPEAYLYNLIYDRGLFPGMAVRGFMQSMIGGYLSRQIIRNYGMGFPGGHMNFEQFYDLTGVDLVLTGANITRHRPAVFSKRHTPRFPVAEATAISMNLPLIFKPVRVDADVPAGQYNQNADDYHGFWVDGGILNNFPLHAFDFQSPQVSQRYPHLRPLNPHMLGLRLTEGPSTGSGGGGGGTFSVLLEFFGNLLDTVLYPSEQGQIRTEEEAEQTIDLHTYDLETTNFAPSQSQRAQPVREAEAAVRDYFSGSP